MERVVEFDISAKYDLGVQNNKKVNKLFGWGYINGFHHSDSVRFGWNWNNDTSKVRLYAYYYVNGDMEFKEICEISLHWKFLLQIDKIGSVYSFTVSDARNNYVHYGGVDVPFTHTKSLGYRLGCYFGGDDPAPHDIKIKITKK